MLGEKLHSQIFELFRFMREAGAQSLQEDLTFTQIRLMIFISHGKTQSMMAEAMLVTPAAISKMIDGMVQRGLLTRKPDEDRRRQLLGFTPTGKKIFNKFTKEVVGKFDEKIQLLTIQEQKQLEQGLTVLDKLLSL